MVRLFGPAEREFPLLLICCQTISAEKRDTELSSEHSLWSFSLAIRVDMSLEWGDVEVNCLANAVTISPLRVRDLEKKVMG